MTGIRKWERRIADCGLRIGRAKGIAGKENIEYRISHRRISKEGKI
jgi:hypothetical protein